MITETLCIRDEGSLEDVDERRKLPVRYLPVLRSALRETLKVRVLFFDISRRLIDDPVQPRRLFVRQEILTLYELVRSFPPATTLILTRLSDTLARPHAIGKPLRALRLRDNKDDNTLTHICRT